MVCFETVFWGLSKKEIEFEIYRLCQTALQKQYGEMPDEHIVKRVKEEWEAAVRSDSVLDIAVLYEITQWLKAAKEPF